MTLVIPTDWFVQEVEAGRRREKILAFEFIMKSERM